MTAEELIERMQALHMNVIVSAPDPHGADNIDVPLDQLLSWVERYEECVADRAGVTVEQYRAWLAADMWVQCAALKRDGSRCMNCVRRGDRAFPDQWVQLQGGFCRVHEPKMRPSAREKD